MINTLAVISLLTVAAVAQTNTSATSPLIPTNISPGCSTFLNALDSDSSMSSCMQPLVSAVSAFAPNGKGSSSSLSSTLSTLCSSTSMCDQSTIQSQLANFQTACSAELQTNVNSAVVNIYDVIYTMIPLKQAVCSQDGSGYCIQSAAANTNGSKTDVVENGGSDVQQYLYEAVSKPLGRRGVTDEEYTLNSTTWTANNVAFLGLQPTLPSAQLCVACTRNIMTPYITFESNVPYTPGLSQSSILSGQSALYNAIQSTCGASFLSGAVQAAGGLGNNGPLKGAAVRSTSGNSAMIFGIVIIGLATLL